MSEEAELRGSYLWGLIEPPGDLYDCQGNGVQRVTARTNLGYALLTVVSLGTVSLTHVEYACAGDTDAEERID